MPTQPKNADDPDDPHTTAVQVSAPALPDGAAMWRIARDSGALDLNSSYAYLLFCRDFAETSRIATVGDDVAGFVIGYRRPDRPDCLFVWQIAVDERYRGRRVSSLLLDDLMRTDGPPIGSLETTITDDNTASQALFAAFARRWGAELTARPLFEAGHFPDGHAAEPLYEIGPLTGAPSAAVPATQSR